jgi:hypothetical protein
MPPKKKVFKLRLDEGRANVQPSTFADLGLRQPFLSDFTITYLQTLGKNQNPFSRTPLFTLTNQ